MRGFAFGGAGVDSGKAAEFAELAGLAEPAVSLCSIVPILERPGWSVQPDAAGRGSEIRTPRTLAAQTLAGQMTLVWAAQISAIDSIASTVHPVFG